MSNEEENSGIFERLIAKSVGGAIGIGGIGFLYMVFFVPSGPDLEGVLIMAGLGATYGLFDMFTN